MPKLFQINTVANWGSTGRIAEGIGEAAMKRGWECWMAYGRGEPVSKMHLVRVGHQRDMYINALKTRIFDNEGLFAKRATRRLIEEMRLVEPDVVHLHNIHGYYLNYPLLFSYLAEADIPVVWTLHDCWSFTGHCTHFDYVGCQRWKSGCHDCPQRREYPTSLFTDNSRRNYEWKRRCFNLPRRMTIVPVSDWLAGLVRQSFLGAYPVRRIYNGVDLQKFHPVEEADAEVRRRYDIRARRFLLGVASTWSRRKGLEDFFSLREELPREDFDIVLLGLTKKQIAQLPQGIIGVERTNSVEEMAELYSAADVVLNLSCEETFGMTTVEGFACGTPGVVYDKTASPELIADSSCGTIVPHNDIRQLAKAVKFLAASPHKAAISIACRQRAEQLYNCEERFAEYVRLYEQLAEKYFEILNGGGKCSNTLIARPDNLRRRYDIRARRFLLGVASTWSRRKGLEDFFALREELPREDFDIVLLGLTKKQIAQLPQGIIGVERTNSVEEMAELYSAADVFVNPTWEDNFPTTNLEALACGTPVVTYRTGGSVEAVDELTGRIVEQGDHRALAAAINELASTNSRSALRHACRERAERLYDKGDRFAEYVDLYESLLGSY